MRNCILVFACLQVTVSVAFADCDSKKPVQPSEFSSAMGNSLLNKMVAACNGGVPENFFALQTDDARRLVSGSSGPKQQQQFAQYCDFTKKGIGILGGQPESAVHSIKVDSYKTDCGQKISTWYVHNSAGLLALRLKVAIESGEMKIDTH